MSLCLLQSALWALRGQASGAQELMEYPDGAEFASGWQYAESEWQQSAYDEHEELSSPE